MIVLALLSTFMVGDSKGEVAAAQLRIEQAANQPAERALAKVELAKALWQDQNQEGAFSIYLEALQENSESNKPLAYASEEEPPYNKALALYLNHRPEEAKIYSQNLLATFGPLAKNNPDWSRLGFVLASAEANLGEFDCFFDRFYSCYQRDPTHFLAYKTLAILHIKLFERAKSPGAREALRAKILAHLTRAYEIYPQDTSLIKLQIAYYPPENKNQLTCDLLAKLLDAPVTLSRADTLYFIELTQSLNDKSLADRWLKKGLELYPDSRKLKQMAP